MSLKLKFENGVPPGSLLSPLLFPTFIKDLPSYCDKSIPLFFADEAKLLRIGLHTEAYQSEVDAFFVGTKDNKLPLILDKSAPITFKGDVQTFVFDGDAVETKRMEKILNSLYKAI